MSPEDMLLILKKYWEYKVIHMKKKILQRGLFGFPLGISLGYAITIIISLSTGLDTFSPCVPSLTQSMGNENYAVLLQAILSGLLGSTFAMSSLIWEIESWGIAKQTGIYFAITSLAMMPIAYLANWMEHSVTGFLVYFGIFVVIFIVIWVIQYIIWQIKIKRLNDKIKS